MQSYFSHSFLRQPSLHLRMSPQVNFMGLLDKRRVLMSPNLQSGITIIVRSCKFTKKLRSPRSSIMELCWSQTAISMSGSQHAFGTPAQQGQAGLALGNKEPGKATDCQGQRNRWPNCCVIDEKIPARLLLCRRDSFYSLPFCLPWLLLLTAQVLSLFSALFIFLCA